jgi:SAM-dependent methyltransferase
MRSRFKAVFGRAVGSVRGRPRNALHRWGAWLARETAPAGQREEPSGPTEVSIELPPHRPVPLPSGLEEAALGAIFGSWSIDGEPEGHMDAYVADSFQRFLHTWGLARGLSGRCLELGANPYFTTYLLEQHADLELDLANYFDQSDGERTQVVTFRDSEGSRQERKYRFQQFNVEEDTFPYDDDSFDVVVFCEIVEHLLMNPVGVLGEISRITRTDGHLVLTTPNVCRIDNAMRVVNGENIYDPYSGYGPYGRHNREYTMDELHALLRFVGFEVEEHFTADGHRSDHSAHPRFAEVAPLLIDRADDLGGYLFVRARKVRPPRRGLPTNLYRSWPPEDLVEP